MSVTAAGHPASWSLSRSLMSALHRSRSIGTTRLYLTLTPPLTTASKLDTCITQGKRHVKHIAFAMVGLVTTQLSSWITLTVTHHKTKHKGTFQPCVRTVMGLGRPPSPKQDLSACYKEQKQIRFRLVWKQAEGKDLCLVLITIINYMTERSYIFIKKVI
jgi:hypothetical protein